LNFATSEDEAALHAFPRRKPSNFPTPAVVNSYNDKLHQNTALIAESLQIPKSPPEITTVKVRWAQQPIAETLPQTIEPTPLADYSVVSRPLATRLHILWARDERAGLLRKTRRGERP